MSLQLNTDVARRVLSMMERRTDVEDIDWAPVHWQVCTNCAWVGISHEQGSKRCQRPAGEMNRYTGNVFNVGGLSMECPNNQQQLYFPPVLDAAMWSALRIGGTNAVIELLNTLQPEQLGMPTQHEAYQRKLLER